MADIKIDLREIINLFIEKYNLKGKEYSVTPVLTNYYRPDGSAYEGIYLEIKIIDPVRS